VGQVREGRRILESYYDRFIEKEAVVRQPLAVEGKIQSKLQVGDLEFLITGRYDRIDFLPDGLELIDYKSGQADVPTNGDMDLQIGLYYIALEQTYSQSLKYLSLLYLRTGEKIRFVASRQHKKRALEVVSDLAVKLRQDEAWVPTPGKGCDRCSYSRYCSAMPGQTTALPEALRPARSLQLALPLSA
jgi:putative RecB family exonuclease